jgi:hypothetical protein
MKCAFIGACVILGLIDGSFAQQQDKLKMPGHDVQNLMLGSWSTQVRYAATPEMPNGGTGSGTEIWRPGPGSLCRRQIRMCSCTMSYARVLFVPSFAFQLCRPVGDDV